jgi:hypothetical protein
MLLSEFGREFIPAHITCRHTEVVASINGLVGPVASGKLNIELVGRMTVNSLPLPGFNRESLHNDLLIFQ